MKTVFFGSSTFVIPIIEVLKKYFGLSLVVVKSDNDPLVKFCKENEIEYAIASKIDDNLIEKIKQTEAEIGIVADFGVIFSKEVLDLFPLGILNIHPSLLPKFRGPTPAQSAILDNQAITGVTLFKLDEEIDHGPIIAQEEFELTQNITTPELLEVLFKLGANLIEANLEDYFTADLLPVEQNENDTTFTIILKKEDGFIDINKIPSKAKLNQMIRAFHSWPGVWTNYPLNPNRHSLIKFLPEEKLQVEGKKPMKYKDFINGYLEGKKFLEKFNLIAKS